MAAAINPPLFLLRPRFHFDNKSYELALPRRLSLAYDAYAYDASAAVVKPPPPSYVNFAPYFNAAHSTRRRNSFESAVGGYLESPRYGPYTVPDASADVVADSSASTTSETPAQVSDDPSKKAVEKDKKDADMPRAAPRRPTSGEIKAQPTTTTSLNANDIFFIAGGIERLDASEMAAADVGAAAAPRVGVGGVPTGGGPNEGEGMIRPGGENISSLRPRGETRRSMTSLTQLNQSSPPNHIGLNDQVSSPDRRSSQIPVYDANPAPVVIAFPAPRSSAVPHFDAPPTQTGNDADIAAMEARRHERDNFYADVDVENTSMRGRILSPSTEEDQHRLEDCSGCVSTTTNCFECLKRIPCASTFALAILLAGLACLSASLLIAARKTRHIFALVGLRLENRTGNVFSETSVGGSSSLVPLDFAETVVLALCVGMFLLAFAFLVVAFFSSGISRRIHFMRKQSHNICGRLLNGFMFATAYCFILGWIGVSGLLSVPIYLLYVFQDNCSESYGEAKSTTLCLDLLNYGIITGKNFQVCGTNLSRLCKESVALYPAYICAYVGSVVVVCSLIHFLVCITANYAHIKKDRPLGPNGGGGGDDSLHGEEPDSRKQKADHSETIERIRDDVMNVFRSDFSDANAQKDSGGIYFPSGRIQNDLVNYWLQ